MANAPIGNNFFEGSLGVVRLNFNNVELGQTVGEASIEFIEDKKDIMFAQAGTQPADKIPTGQAYQVTCSLGEISLTILEQILRGFDAVGDNAKIGRDIYRSGLTNFAKQLVITRVDSSGNAYTTSDKFRLTFYKAFPQVNGAIGAFGADTQRVVEVVFYIFFYSTKDAYGYIGDETSAGITA